MEDIRISRWNPEKTIQTANIPWENETNWMKRIRRLVTVIRDLTSNETDYSKSFFDTQMALFVFDANRMEGTISPQHIEGQTIGIIKGFLLNEVPELISWNAEGGREVDNLSSSAQLYQGALAAKFLLVQHVCSPLSKELIIQAHQIMMTNSYDIDRNRIQQPVEVGKFRTDKEVNAGMYQFVPAKAVLGAMSRLISEYERKREEGYNPIALATFLFYEMITIHPFTNGNGRLCRMFLTWSLMRDGFPFPVSFSSCHSKRRQHYLHAIQTARRPDIHGGDATNRGELNLIAVISLERTIGNYLTNLQHMKYCCEEDSEVSSH